MNFSAKLDIHRNPAPRQVHLLDHRYRTHRITNLDVPPAGTALTVPMPTPRIRLHMLAHQAAIAQSRRHIPNALAIASYAPADIAHSGALYARYYLQMLDHDAAVIDPWGGLDTIKPWAAYPNRGVFVRVLPHSPDSVARAVTTAGTPVYLEVAAAVNRAFPNGNVGIYAHVREPDEAANIAAATPNLPLLLQYPRNTSAADKRNISQNHPHTVLELLPPPDEATTSDQEADSATEFP